MRPAKGVTVGGLQSTEKIRHFSFPQLSGRRPYPASTVRHSRRPARREPTPLGRDHGQPVRCPWRLAPPRSGDAIHAPPPPRAGRRPRHHARAGRGTGSACSSAHSVDFRCRHVEATQPGELLNQDTFYWGTLKGVGKVYVQVVVDVFCSFAFAKVYTSKMPITAATCCTIECCPSTRRSGVPSAPILTDNGREFCGRSDQHPFELLLAMDGIQHRTTQIRSPRTNGFVERMNLHPPRRVLPRGGPHDLVSGAGRDSA